MAERKAHVVRLKGRQRGSSTPLDDVFIDMRRSDEIVLIDRGNGQKRSQLIKWDDGFGDPPNDPDRRQTIIKVTDPQSPPDDPNDPDIYVPVPVVDQLSVYDADQKIILSFRNKRDEDRPTTRQIRVTRVTHAETDGDLGNPVDASSYRRQSDTEDKGQYVDAEVIENFSYQDADQRHNDAHAVDDDELLQLFSAPSGEKKAPIRLDPFQNIVNVSWSPKIYVVVITNTSGASAVPLVDRVKLLDSDSFIPDGSETSVTGVLLEASANAGDDVIGLNISVAPDPDAGISPFYEVFLLPHTQTIRDSWFSTYVEGRFETGAFSQDGSTYLWWLTTFLAFGAVKLSMKYAPHLRPPVPDGSRNNIAQLWPSMESTAMATSSGHGGDPNTVTVSGYSIESYRTDAKGTGRVYNGRVGEWIASVIGSSTLSGDFDMGIPFGSKPPLLSGGDTPL